MATVHNPTHFEPADYEVVDYLDNKRPVYYGQDLPTWELDIKDWEADMARVLGTDWRRKSHACVHCGNSRVRWITATRHLPTNDVVVFGADCTDRLGFANKHAFKLALLQKKAAGVTGRLKVWTARQDFLAAHPDVQVALDTIGDPVHAKNFFAHDVLGKLNKYGSLSDKQVTAVLASLDRDLTYADRKAAQDAEPKGDAPEGRVQVTGEVLSVQTRDSHYGPVQKLLIKLPNNSKVWVSKPVGAGINRGDTVTLKATFERAKDDRSFAFGRLPSLV